MSKCWYCNEEILTGNNPEHIGICDKCYNEMFKCGNNIIGKLMSKITDLEAKLAESENQHNKCVDNLIQQLAEKETELEKYKIKDTVGLSDFIKNSYKKLTIQQLEKVKKEVCDEIRKHLKDNKGIMIGMFNEQTLKHDEIEVYDSKPLLELLDQIEKGESNVK